MLKEKKDRISEIEKQIEKEKEKLKSILSTFIKSGKLDYWRDNKTQIDYLIESLTLYEECYLETIIETKLIESIMPSSEKTPPDKQILTQHEDIVRRLVTECYHLIAVDMCLHFTDESEAEIEKRVEERIAFIQSSIKHCPFDFDDKELYEEIFEDYKEIGLSQARKIYDNTLM